MILIPLCGLLNGVMLPVEWHFKTAPDSSDRLYPYKSKDVNTGTLRIFSKTVTNLQNDTEGYLLPSVNSK
jgi:hypothetical protein